VTQILGISAFYHDSAAALIRDGCVVAAIQEERLTRRKHDNSFPAQAVQACLRLGRTRLADIDFVVFYEKPFAKFERLLETYLSHAPRGLRSYLKAMPLWVKDRIWIKDRIARELKFDGEILFADHHESHAASAFYLSPFSRAAILTVDGVGEWTTTALGFGNGSDLTLIKEIRFPHSLGLLYSTFTYYLGFKINDGEYKVMGLAPYGQPRYLDRILGELMVLEEDGSFRLNPEYFEYETGLRMASRRFCEYFGRPPRRPGEPLEQFHKDLAASIQKATEEALLRAARHLQELSGEPALCMAGGVALNCVANGRILRETPFQRLWVQPAAGDAGGSVGAALAVWYRHLGQPRSATERDGQQASLLGTVYGEKEMELFLESQGAVFRRLSREEVPVYTASRLAEGAVVGWFQGRMEFGPRALGSRSILADPRRPETLDEVNRRIKYRESFRPFAPIVPLERAGQYFDLQCPSPYMLLVAPVLEHRRGEIPAVTHVDGSARVQTVERSDHPLLYQLLIEFGDRTGCPVVLNTSFNVRGEPIVESPADAWRCFMRTDMDLLVMGDFIIEKRDQPDGLAAVRESSPFVPEGAPRPAGGQARRLFGLPFRLLKRLGQLIGRFNSGLLMTLSFFVILWPTGLVRRLASRQPEVGGWLDRHPLGADHYRRQY
jgi:carbamoyltransferase